MSNKLAVNPDKNLNFDLYHGTSTLFLDSIVQHGLGAINPVKEWNILDLCREVYELSEEYLRDTQLYANSIHSFKMMAEQSNEKVFNYQHGDTYLSPAKSTAIRYAINKEYGSEMLTYTIDFLKELLKKEISYVSTELYQKYWKIYDLIEAKPSPLLVQIKNVNINSLLSEKGDDPIINLNILQDFIKEGNESFEIMGQQLNFRLTTPIDLKNLQFWLINVHKYHQFAPLYNLYEIKTGI